MFDKNTNSLRLEWLSGIEIDNRKKILFHLKSVIQKNKTLIYSALKKDLGKSYTESHITEVGYVLNEIDEALQHLSSWSKPITVNTPTILKPARSQIYSEPYGRVLIIAPWNYPFQLVFSPLVGALAAGNSIVVKPSEISKNTENVISDIIRNHFDPRNISVELGDAEKTTVLLKEKWDFIFFTGSSIVGKKIMKAASENWTPVCLELGGKSPCIVDCDASIAVAAKRIAWGKFLNCGQTCVAPDYLLVHEKIYDQFLSEFIFRIKEFYKEGFSDDYGRIINLKHWERLVSIISDAKIIYGGNTDSNLLKISPTLIEGDLLHSSMKDEIFGPILPIFKYSNKNDIKSIISRYPKPLAAYYFTENKNNEDWFLKEFSFGGGCINDCVLHLGNSNLPFGGVGSSGMGSYHGKSSFDLFSHKKSVLKKPSWLDVNLRYPPYEHTKKSMSEIIKKIFLKMES